MYSRAEGVPEQLIVPEVACDSWPELCASLSGEQLIGVDRWNVPDQEAEFVVGRVVKVGKKRLHVCYVDSEGVWEAEPWRIRYRDIAAISFGDRYLTVFGKHAGGPERALKWLFFDVGSTLVDETAAYDRRIREMIAGTDVTFEQFQQKREEFARQNLRGDLEAAAFFGLTKTPWRHEDEVPYPDADMVLGELKNRGYRIGIIANQSAGTTTRLEQWGLMPHIDLVVASAEEGVAKPDPAIFRLALTRAGCLPEEAAMIGDRLDNDMEPAKAIGMRTVWLPQGPAVWQSVRRDEERPDLRVQTLPELLEVFP
ncbi:MAG: HAD family hydrolase [Clostridia bacterium]|nr:HAD family hydrolase [Clostridia bacterium]